MCGTEHDRLATVFRSDAPESWVAATNEEQSAGLLGTNGCTLPGSTGVRSFIRGHVVLPVRDQEIPEFIWSIWVEIAKGDMIRFIEYQQDERRTELPPYDGHLDSRLAAYSPPALGLRVAIVNREPGVVPLLLLDRNQDHALVREQAEGITLHRVWELNER